MPLRFRRVALRAILTISVVIPLWIAASLPAVINFSACNGSVGPGDSIVNVTPPKDNVQKYVVARAAECLADVTTLETIAEPGNWKSNPDTAGARNAWRAARRKYELMRFGMVSMLPVLHKSAALWLTQNPPGGFHYLEKFLFTPGADVGSLELKIEDVAANMRSVPNQLNIAGVSDDGIFRGLQITVKEIDSIKLSGADSALSANSYADIFTNLDAIDSVYGYYQSVVIKKAPAADTALLNRVSSTRASLTAAHSMAGLDKAAFRGQLTTINDAIKSVAAVFNVSLP